LIFSRDNVAESTLQCSISADELLVGTVGRDVGKRRRGRALPVRVCQKNVAALQRRRFGAVPTSPIAAPRGQRFAYQSLPLENCFTLAASCW
jgi:hypothetical protein